MPYIEWTESLELGIPLIDRDHKILVSILNQVHDAIGNAEELAVLSSALSSLAEYTGYHFAREEKLLEVAGFDGLEGHHQRHQELEAEVKAIGTRYKEDSQSVQGEEVLTFLRSWLIDHIMKHDMAYRDACLGKTAAYAAAEAISFGDSISSKDGAGAKAGEAAEAPIAWGGLKVLVVEDNKNFQLIIQTILKSLGVRNISAVGSAREGLDFLSGHDMDLVLCDWRMDEMDGLEFVRKAREMELGSKIIMMSGYGSDDIHAKAMDAGVDDFIEKPITARGFLDVAAKVLRG